MELLLGAHSVFGRGIGPSERSCEETELGVVLFSAVTPHAMDHLVVTLTSDSCDCPEAVALSGVRIVSVVFRLATKQFELFHGPLTPGSADSLIDFVQNLVESRDQTVSLKVTERTEKSLRIHVVLDSSAQQSLVKSSTSVYAVENLTDVLQVHQQSAANGTACCYAIAAGDTETIDVVNLDFSFVFHQRKVLQVGDFPSCVLVESVVDDIVVLGDVFQRPLFPTIYGLHSDRMPLFCDVRQTRMSAVG